MSTRGRLRSNDRLRGFGEARIPVMVTWYSEGSSKQKPERILRVLLDPRGWHIVGDDFRTDPQTWLDATRPTLEDGTLADLDARDAGKVVFTNLRRFPGFDKSMPLDIAAWPTGKRFYVGTGAWGRGEASLDALRQDCERAKMTRRPQRVAVAREDDARVTWS